MLKWMYTDRLYFDYIYIFWLFIYIWISHFSACDWRLKLSAANQGICQHLPDLFHKQVILTPTRDPSNPRLCRHQHVVTQLSAQRSTAPCQGNCKNYLHECLIYPWQCLAPLSPAVGADFALHHHKPFLRLLGVYPWSERETLHLFWQERPRDLYL